jgi:hypothetical protein
MQEPSEREPHPGGGAEEGGFGDERPEARALAAAAYRAASTPNTQPGLQPTLHVGDDENDGVYRPWWTASQLKKVSRPIVTPPP